MLRRWSLVLAVLGVAASPTTRAAEEGSRPSVLIVLVDDLGWRDLSATGSTAYRTPHVDRLFDSGVHLARGYASCQVCSPTRASLMTGKAPPRHGVTDWIGAAWGDAWDRNTPLLPAPYAHRLAAEETTLAETFRDAGYRTFFAGKWHVGGEGSLPTDHGFETNLGGHHRGSPPGGFFSPYRNPLLPDGPPGESLPARLGAETARYVAADDDRPFFAVLSFYSVHSPLQTTRGRWAASRRRLAGGDADATRFAIDRTLPVRQKQDHPVYAGMVEAMDDAVGTVLDALERSDRLDNTIVVFTSDNGGVSSGDAYATSNLPLRGGKGRAWEGGLRVPLAIAWGDRLPRGAWCGTPATTADLYPTLLELVGLPLLPSQHADGVSLAPALYAASNSGWMAPVVERLNRRPLYWHYPHYGNQGGEPSSVVQRDGWKLIRYHEDGREELYHLGADEGEHNDVAAEHPGRVAELAERLDAWLKETDARMPTPNPRYDAAAAAREQRSRRERLMPRLEATARQVLAPDYEPGPDWWGSTPAQSDASTRAASTAK